MACEGCKINITVWAGSSPDITAAFTPEGEGKDGACFEYAGECTPDEPCVFKGEIKITVNNAGPAGTVWYAESHPHGGAAHWADRDQQGGVSDGQIAEIFLHIGQGGTTLNESMCEGLVSHPVSGDWSPTNGYGISVWKDGEQQTFSATLYCGLCD